MTGHLRMAGFVSRLCSGQQGLEDRDNMYKNLIPSIVATVMTVSGGVFATEISPSPERQRELARFVRQECGFCHGLRLTGGLGSPLTAQTMKDRPVELMVAIILRGNPGSAMPGWQPYLNEVDAQWIVQALQEGLLDERR